MDALSDVAKPPSQTAAPGEQAAPGTLSNWRLLAYAGVALPWSLAGLPILVYLPAFYAKELHLSAGWVGVVFLSARLWDAASDVLVGWFSDRSQSRFGRRKPWVIVGAPLLMLATWLLCNPPPGAGLLYLAISAGLFYTAFTVVGIPYLSWGAELATGYVERSRVTSFREGFMMLGNLFFASAPLLLPTGAPLQSVLLLIAVAVLVMVPLTTLLLGCYVPDPAPRQHAEVNLFKGLVSLARDRVFRKFLLVPFFVNLSGGTINSLAVFSLGVGLQLPDKLFSVIFIIYVATLCALPVTFRLCRHFEKHHLLAGAFTVQALAYASLLFVPPGDFTSVAITWVIVGMINAAGFILPTSMLADVIDNGEVVDGERRSGAYVAIYNLLMKLGLALGVGLAFGLLEVIDFNPGATQHTDADAANIRLVGFGLPSLLFLPAILALITYPISRKVHSQLRDHIEARATGAVD